jgi:hypothetical protein
MHIGIVKKYLKSKRLHEILNDDLDLLCNSLNLDMRAYIFILELKVTNDWKDYRWWIMAEEAEMPMLWITSHAVVEGRHKFTRRAV